MKETTMPNVDLKSAIEEATRSFLSDIEIKSVKSLVDKVVHGSLNNLVTQVNGHAVAIWLHEQKPEGEALTIAYNVGEKGHDVEGVVSQPLDDGLVSKAFKEEKTICHQGVFKHKEQSTDVDKELGQMTAHQIAAPFSLFGKTIGAITVIQTLAKGYEQQSEWGFDKSDIEYFETSVDTIQRLLELNVIRKLG